ncbi:hypothetical protein [Thermococcus sp.]
MSNIIWWYDVKVAALLPVVLIVGALLNVGGVAATQINGTQQNGPYQSFWEILGREGQLVVQLNDSPSESTASELVLNSRAGEENAANISAGIWKALVELEKSGVKLYYSEDELREMADEIASKGLPNETVSELRSAGWTDEEIKALQEYIAEQRNHIEGGFNMKYFLDGFAKAFISVGWKYASYEAWAIKKGWWRDLRSPPTAGEEAVNPYIGSYRSVASAISGRNSGAFLSSVKDMRKELYHLLTDSAEVYYPNGGIAFRTVSYTSNGRVVEIYYWPNALDAYRELSRLYTLAAAISDGYSTDEMWDVASQEILELGRLMTVRLISSSHSSNAPVPYYLDLPSLSLGSAPYLTVDRVEVTVSGYSYDRIFYRILVHYTVHGSAVMVQNVTISSGDRRYYLSPGILYSGSGIWESGDFSIPDDSPSFKVGGFVSARYGPGESPGGAVPTGGKIGPRSGNPSASYLPTGSLIRDALVFYHEDLYRVSPINPANVNFTIKAVRAGSRVRYEAQLYNSNELPVSGVISLYSEVPDGNYLTVKQINVTHVTLAPSDNRTVYLGTVDYSRPGSYEYFGIFRFFNYSESDNGEVLIPSPPSPVGSLRILDAKFSPDLPKEGETVTFHVTVQSAYHLSSSVNLMLYIDGQPVGETSGTIGPDSTKTFSMRWFAEAGTHSYMIKLYKLNREQRDEEDKEIGSISVSRVVDGISAWLNVDNNPAEAGGNITLFITIENSKDYRQTWPIQLVGDDGNILWPHKRYLGVNYSVSSDGYLTIYAHKTARITTTVGPITHNMSLTLNNP